MREMHQGKQRIAWVKSEATNLLRKLKEAATSPEDIKVGLVPFDTHVRVNPNDYRSAEWLDLKASQRSDWRGYISDRGTKFRPTIYDTNDNQWRPREPESLYPADTDRQDRELAVVQPLLSVYGGNPAKPNSTILEDGVSAMKPVGCTNITIGAAWGMAMLSNQEPLAGAAAPSGSLEKVMVIVTDGENTQNRWYGKDNNCKTGTSETRKIDERTKLACDDAKAKGIKVMTIRLLEGDRNLLRECASVVTDPKSPFYNDGKPLFFNVEGNGELSGAFQTIINMILGTRITA
jgi:hypothetical protein